MEQFVDQEVIKAAKESLCVESKVWQAVEQFTNWMRGKVKLYPVPWNYGHHYSAYELQLGCHAWQEFKLGIGLSWGTPCPQNRYISAAKCFLFFVSQISKHFQTNSDPIIVSFGDIFSTSDHCINFKLFHTDISATNRSQGHIFLKWIDHWLHCVCALLTGDICSSFYRI